tara:strand:- start:1894 stop:2676 length:783 start_codon:yes stop_codon:yes gene_type:complete
MKVIDTHIHYGTDPHVAKHTCCPDLIRGNPDSVIKFLEAQNASNGVLFPHDRVMSPPWDADYDKANMQVGEAVLKYPNEIAGVARINPTFGSKHTQNLIEKYVKEWGCRGLKLVAGYDFYRPNDMDVVGPMLDKCNEYNLTVLFHSGDSSRDLPYLQAQVAKAYPEVTFVLAHIGMHHFLWEAIIACQEYKNINVDMSQAFPFDIKTFISNVGTERLTYGSDAPYQSTRIEQEKLRVIDLPQDDLVKVFRENAQRIWNFK